MRKAEKIMRGIEIILKYDSNADVCAAHDEIFCGHWTYEKMSDDDKVKMDALGWEISVDESWRMLV